MIRGAFDMGIVDWWNVPCYLPVPRADEVHARLLVEAAIFGDANPEERPPSLATPTPRNAPPSCAGTSWP